MNEDRIRIRPSAPVDAVVRPPGSKSITNRAMVCAALAAGRSTLSGVLDSEDTHVMRDALARIGFDLAHDQQRRSLDITGLGGAVPPSPEAVEQVMDLYIANSGTTVRFLTAMLALAQGEGSYRLHGTERMSERPIADLLDALEQMGAEAHSELGNDCPPVIVRVRGSCGGTANVAGDISSQYLSGLLMAAPAADGDVEIEVSGPLVSKPYVTMTLDVMRAFGVKVHAREDLTHFAIGADQTYKGCSYAIEPDASAASYFFAAAAVTGGRVTVEGLSRKSLQGDVAFCDCLERMGCVVTWGDDSITVEGRPLNGVTVNMKDISDTAQTLGAVALFADGPTTIEDIANVRHKETDRIAAMATELRKLGAEVDEREDGMTITPPKTLQPAEIATYDDHRMAMSFAVAGLAFDGVTILDPGCAAKTYPEFFEDLAKITR